MSWDIMGEKTVLGLKITSATPNNKNNHNNDSDKDTINSNNSNNDNRTLLIGSFWAIFSPLGVVLDDNSWGLPSGKLT